MAHANFVHLRVNTAYSLSEGAIHIPDLLKQCQGFAMPAVAVTDTNNMFGALEFSEYAKKAGVQPIVGVSLSVENPYLLADRHGKRPDPDILVLLAKNDAGYRNLMKIVSSAHLNADDHDTPRVDVAALKQCSQGIICLTGGVSGPVGHLLLDGQDDKAEKMLLDLVSIYGDCLYLEIQRHDMPEEKATEERFIDLAYKHNIALVATNQPYFIKRDMYEAHDALLCMADGAFVAQDDRRKVTPEHRFKSAEEMERQFADLPEAIANTLVVAKRCAHKVDCIDPLLPNFTQGQDISESDLLQTQAEEGLRGRLDKSDQITASDEQGRKEQEQPYWDRLKFELGVIKQMGFPGYFLIVADFIKWSKENDIPVGPGRGSGAGSVVAWALLITDLDPLRFSLLFERFLNPERVSMPDFDIDFCQDKRELVIKYVQDKYGDDHVAQIITFGKLQARAVVKACGRVMQQPYPVSDRLSKLIPNDPGNMMTLQEAITSEQRLRDEIRDDELTAAVMDRALKLEGLYAHSSTHAAGVVIGDRPLDQLVPLYRDPKSDMPVTQFNMKWVEQAGLVKFDFLGLKTLTVLDLAVNYIKARGITVDLSQLPLDDALTYQMLASGDAAGVFQLESAGMRSVLRGLKPDTFEDIIAVVALYRPGPMANIPTYIKRKHGEEEVTYKHPMLEEILEETNGIFIYQEQVMQLAQKMAGYSLGQADILRRAMGKKIAEEMERQVAIFIKGAKERGVDEKVAEEIFNDVMAFASYGFNKSHAAAYALVAYHTAYLKANYPVEFMAAIMTLDMGNTDKLAAFKQDLVHLNIPVLLPNINKSYPTFRVEKAPDSYDEDVDDNDPRMKQGVRYALAAIKGVGEKAMENIIEERDNNGDFKDLFDFAERIDPKLLNKRQIEQLASAGAFDCLNPDRAQVRASADVLMRLATMRAQERASNQVSLFGEEMSEIDRPQFPKIKMWTETDMLDAEHKAVGFYLSAHPLDTYETVLERERIIPASEAYSSASLIGETVRMAGAIAGYREGTSKKSGNKFGILSLSDRTDGFEVLVFDGKKKRRGPSDAVDDGPSDLERARTLVELGAPLVLNVEIRKRDGEDEVGFSCRGMESLEQVASQSATSLVIDLELDKAQAVKETLEGVKAALDMSKGGKGKVIFKIPLDKMKQEAEVRLRGTYKVTPKLRQAVAAERGVSQAKEI